MSYYDRQTTYLDGIPTWKNQEDEANEQEVARLAEDKWDCHLHSYGRMSPLDWWAERDHQIVGFLELKSHPYESTRYPEAWLNQRKWLAMSLAMMSGPPAILIVKWTDCVKWIHLGDIDPTRLKVAGTTRVVKSRNDREPIIHIPMGDLKAL